MSSTSRIKLHNILEKNKDAEKGYAKAATHAKKELLQAYLEKKSLERRGFWETLRATFEEDGLSVDDSGSVLGNMHRSWMDLRNLISKDNDRSMLIEAIKGEKASLKEYTDIIEKEILPTRIMSLLQEQKSTIEKNLATIKTLEDIR